MIYVFAYLLTASLVTIGCIRLIEPTSSVLWIGATWAYDSGWLEVSVCLLPGLPIHFAMEWGEDGGGTHLC